MILRGIQWLAAVAPLLIAGVWPNRQSAAAEPTVAGLHAPAEPRVYESGPLTARDFQAAVPADDGGLDAWTTTDLSYRYKYESRSSGRQARAWTTQVTVEALVDPGRSWNRHPDDRQLLDHEQGHFDLTQISALRARRHFAEQRISITATSAEMAVRNLETELARQMQEFFDALKREQEQYDRLTNHGRIPSRQQEHRQTQHQELAKLKDKEGPGAYIGNTGVTGGGNID